MKLINLFASITLSAAALAASADQQEPISFKGFHPDMTKAEYEAVAKSHYPRHQLEEYFFYAGCMLTEEEDYELSRSTKSNPSNDREHGEEMSCVEPGESNLTIGGQPIYSVSRQWGEEEATAPRFVTSVTFGLYPRHLSELAKVLTEKYGPPASKSGLFPNNSQYLWKLGEYRIEIIAFHHDRTQPVAKTALMKLERVHTEAKRAYEMAALNDF